MFDLFRSRDKSVRILLGALLLLVALSMLTYLVPNYNSGGGSSSDTVVADVGDDTITLTDMEHSIQSALRGKQMPPEMVSTYVPQIVDQMVTEKALAYEARKLGFVASDSDLRTYIQ